MRKIQTEEPDTWRVYMYFPSALYAKFRREAPKEGYTKRELYYDHHVKDYLVSILEKVSE